MFRFLTIVGCLIMAGLLLCVAFRGTDKTEPQPEPTPAPAPEPVTPEPQPDSPPIDAPSDIFEDAEDAEAESASDVEEVEEPEPSPEPEPAEEELGRDESTPVEVNATVVRDNPFPKTDWSSMASQIGETFTYTTEQVEGEPDEPKEEAMSSSAKLFEDEDDGPSGRPEDSSDLPSGFDPPAEKDANLIDYGDLLSKEAIENLIDSKIQAVVKDLESGTIRLPLQQTSACECPEGCDCGGMCSPECACEPVAEQEEPVASTEPARRSFNGFELAPGERITHIDGRPVSSDMSYQGLFRTQPGQIIQSTVATSPSGDVVAIPLSPAQKKTFETQVQPEFKINSRFSVSDPTLSSRYLFDPSVSSPKVASVDAYIADSADGSQMMQLSVPGQEPGMCYTTVDPQTGQSRTVCPQNPQGGPTAVYSTNNRSVRGGLFSGSLLRRWRR